MSRTRKKPYTKSKRFDSTCRNHGSCGYCAGNRTYNKRKTEEHAEQDEKDYEDERPPVPCFMDEDLED